MDPDEEFLLDLIGDFYDAALDPAAWPRALERLSDAFGGVPVHFGVQHLPRGMSWTVSVRRDPIFHRIFQERFAPPHTNPVMEAAKSMRTSTLYPRRSFWDDAAYYASDMHHEIVRPQGQDDFAVAMLVRTVDYVVPFSLYRRIGADPFSASELAFLDRLLPHLNRCLRLQLRLGAAEADRRQLAAALDAYPRALIVLGADGQIMHANARAEALLGAGDGIAARGGRIAASDPRAEGRLRRMIAMAAATGAGLGTDPGGNVVLPRRPPGRPLCALVSPLPNGAIRDRGAGGLALLAVHEPDRQQPAPARLLAELFALTPAEARTALALIEGNRLQDVADRLGVSLATVRTHVQRAFDKTGTHRQADLVRLLLTYGTPRG
jgi:DNA-binding CsgD family transcriptional regulator